MARVRSSKLENRSARLRLARRKKPYAVPILRGVSLLYRRNKVLLNSSRVTSFSCPKPPAYDQRPIEG